MNPALLALLGARVVAGSAGLSVTLTDTVVGVIGTFSAVNIGEASAAREIIVLVGSWSTAAVRYIKSMTIGGVTATKDAGVAGGTGKSQAEIWRAAVPTGTTADIVIAWNTPGATGAYYVLRSPVALTVSDNTNPLTTSSGGLAVALAGALNATAPIAITGLTSIGTAVVDHERGWWIAAAAVDTTTGSEVTAAATATSATSITIAAASYTAA